MQRETKAYTDSHGMEWEVIHVTTDDGSEQQVAIPTGVPLPAKVPFVNSGGAGYIHQQIERWYQRYASAGAEA